MGRIDSTGVRVGVIGTSVGIARLEDPYASCDAAIFDATEDPRASGFVDEDAVLEAGQRLGLTPTETRLFEIRVTYGDS